MGYAEGPRIVRGTTDRARYLAMTRLPEVVWSWVDGLKTEKSPAFK